MVTTNETQSKATHVARNITKNIKVPCTIWFESLDEFEVHSLVSCKLPKVMSGFKNLKKPEINGLPCGDEGSVTI